MDRGLEVCADSFAIISAPTVSTSPASGITWTLCRLNNQKDLLITGNESSLLARLFPEIHWRWTCPDTIDDIAADFIQNRNTWEIADWPKALAYNDGLVLRRRISIIYGVAQYHKDPRRADPSGRGWNRRLWKTVGEITPEQLLDDIFERVAERIAEALSV